MRRMKKPGITALTAAIALGIATVPFGGFAAGVLAEAPTTTTVAPATEGSPAELPSAGTLTLRTTSNAGTVTWSADPEKAQQLSERGGTCALQIEGDNLLRVTGALVNSTTGATTPDREAFRGGSIGVNEGANNAQCFRVDAGSFQADEILRIGLGSDVTFVDSLPVRAESATLDVELRANSMVIEARTYLGTELTGTYQLRTGTARLNSPPPGVLNSAARTGQHVPWTITPPSTAPHFDSIELNALTGSFQLEGGADSGASPTTVDLVYDADYEVCASVGVPYSEDGSDTSVTYVGNASGSDCVAFGARFSAGDEEVVYLKPRDINPDAQFIFDATWKITAKANESFTPTTPIPAVTIDFELGDDNETPLPFCPGALYVDDVLTGFNSPEAYEAFLEDDDVFLDFEPATTSVNTPGYFKEYACIDGSEGVREVALSQTQITVKDKIFVIGDLRMQLSK